jgi:hypothetical protein
MPSWGYDTTILWNTIYFIAVIVISILAIIGLTTIWYVAFHRKGKSRKKSDKVFVVFSAGAFCWTALVGLRAIISHLRGSGIQELSFLIISGYVTLIIGFGFLVPLVFSYRNDSIK